MSHRALLGKTYIAGAALFGSVLVYSAAHAQAPGCCEGGSAFGANAWTAGNNWTGWGGAAPVFDPSAAAVPADAESQAGLKDDGAAPYWWTHGEIEIGGRDFVNDPRVNGQIYGNTVSGTSPHETVNYVHLGQQSLAKYYEYSIQAPGAFGGGHFAMGSSDGLYQLDLWANNVASNFAGFSDQAYTLEASKAGEHYLTVTWDETPHIYSTSAETPYLGVGTDHLTLPSALIPPAGTLLGKTPNTGGPTGAGVIPYLYKIDLGIQRDTISFDYRWTPTDAWDFNTNYSHMDRTGTQAAGITGLGYSPTQYPAPVDDTTQNFGASGERIGDTPWGKYTFKLGYAGSVYTDNISSFTIQNPTFPTAAQCAPAAGGKAGTNSCVAAQMSTPPSNEMNSISGTMTADLPYSTRYAGTVSYTDMTQNQTFLDMTNNPDAIAPLAGVYAGQNWQTINYGFVNRNFAQPVTSLNGDIQEILSNNVFTTRITPDLTSKFSYRFYDFDNGTPNILFPCWVSQSGTGISTATACGGSGDGTAAIQSLSVSYMKQDVGEELNWRPNRDWNFNAAYGFERYDYVEADVNATNENSAKLSADWHPVSWFDARLSGSVADRRYETYNYDEFVVPYQSPTFTYGGVTYTQSNFLYSPAYRQFMYDNRDQTKAQFQTNIVVFPGVTVSPSVKYQDDYYGINPNYNLGINDNNSVSAGVDLTYVPNPDLSLSLSYYYEMYNTLLYSGINPSTGNTLPIAAANLITTKDNQYINTVTAAASYVVIPSKLTLDLRASISDGIDNQILVGCVTQATTSTNSLLPNQCPIPNDTTLFEHVEADLIYKFDPALLSDTGFKDMKLKLRYMWERNAVSNWQNNPLAPYTSFVGNANTALWMAYDNPNYNVQAVSASLIVKW